MNSIWSILQPYLLKVIAVAVIITVTYVLIKGVSKVIGAIFRGAEVVYIVRIVELAKMLLYIIAAIAIANIVAPEAQVFIFIILLIGLAVIFMFIDVLRNMGAELYIRAKDMIRRGDWIEIDGISVKVLDFDTAGVLGETSKLEKVFIPYTKLLNSILINKVTPLGMLVRVYVYVPQAYGIDGARNMLLESLEPVKEDLATEPDITYLGSKGDMLNFVIEFHIINYRKLTKLLASIEREIKNRMPEAVVRT